MCYNVDEYAWEVQHLMKRLMALCLALWMCAGAALAEEQLEYVEPAGDGSEFTYDAESLITSAMEMYAWFVMWPLDVDESMPNADGTLYRLLDERFCQKAEMDALLGAYFSPEIQAELWAWGAYTDIDGVLYAPLDAPWRMMDGRIENVTYELTEETADTRLYTVRVTYTDDADETTWEEETFSYVQILTEGVWQFTEFPFFW